MLATMRLRGRAGGRGRRVSALFVDNDVLRPAGEPPVEPEGRTACSVGAPPLEPSRRTGELTGPAS